MQLIIRQFSSLQAVVNGACRDIPTRSFRPADECLRGFAGAPRCIFIGRDHACATVRGSQLSYQKFHFESQSDDEPSWTAMPKREDYDAETDAKGSDVH